MATQRRGHSLHIYRLLCCQIFIEVLRIICISTNAHKLYVCDALGLLSNNLWTDNMQFIHDF